MQSDHRSIVGVLPSSTLRRKQTKSSNHSFLAVQCQKGLMFMGGASDPRGSRAHQQGQNFPSGVCAEKFKHELWPNGAQGYISDNWGIFFGPAFLPLARNRSFRPCPCFSGGSPLLAIEGGGPDLLALPSVKPPSEAFMLECPEAGPENFSQACTHLSGDKFPRLKGGSW